MEEPNGKTAKYKDVAEIEAPLAAGEEPVPLANPAAKPGTASLTAGLY